MLPLADVGVGVRQHSGYCPSNPYAPGPSSSPNGPAQ